MNLGTSARTTLCISACTVVITLSDCSPPPEVASFLQTGAHVVAQFEKDFGALPEASLADLPEVRLRPTLAESALAIRNSVLPVAICGFALVLAAFGFGGYWGGGIKRDAATGEPQKWSVSGIAALTCYRFYSGYLAATWMPYLLAMEGSEMMSGRQSIFMGTAKLIYGLSILFNPLFGLLGDRAPWGGRRFFILAGVCAEGLGIYGCMLAAPSANVELYLASTALWMLGEAMTDVTSETLVPELLPRSQYDISSSIRSLSFLVGGLVGYMLLILSGDMHHGWIYYSYIVLMVGCACVTLVFLAIGGGAAPQTALTPIRGTLFDLANRAYGSPTRIEGGFPRGCLCIFVFSLGSAPMFFLLLMIRDLVGLQDAALQKHFGAISIIFFLSAALASAGLAVFSAMSATTQPAAAVVERELVCSSPKKRDDGSEPHQSTARPQPEPPAAAATAAEEPKAAAALSSVVVSQVAFALVVSVLPLVAQLPTMDERLRAFYVLSVAFGLSFGTVYARFQECIWNLLPQGVDIANAMGFAAMCKLAGVGLGNFAAGAILDRFADVRSNYDTRGYVVMALLSSGCVFTSAVLARAIAGMAQEAALAGAQNEGTALTRSPGRKGAAYGTA